MVAAAGVRTEWRILHGLLLLGGYRKNAQRTVPARTKGEIIPKLRNISKSLPRVYRYAIMLLP